MKIDFENAKIYVRPGSTDLRKGVTGLAQIIENEMKLNALSESVFLFCNKSHKLLKVIFWNKTGFWIAQKRLERATWPWPNTEVSAREITNEQLMMLLLNSYSQEENDAKEAHFDYLDRKIEYEKEELNKAEK